MMGNRLASIVEALRRQAADRGGALYLYREMTGILLRALGDLARRLDRRAALAGAVARGDVVSLADRRMARDMAAESGPEGAA